MISIVIATYNGKKFIKEQLDSIINQTVLPDEIIIQDDNSIDGTFEFVKEYSKKYLNIRWILNKNKSNVGYITNFYNGICNANGDFIFLADQDDIWLKEKIELMSNLMLKNKKICLLMSNLETFYVENCKNKIHEEFFGIKKIKHFTKVNHCVNTPRPGCSFCIRRSLIEKYKKNINLSFPHDNLIWHIASVDKTAYLYNRSLMKYRRHLNNASNNMENSIEKRILSIDKQLKSIEFLIKYSMDIQNKNFFKKQYEVFEKRLINLNDKRIFKSIGMIRNIGFYKSIREYFVDIYYAIRSI